MKAAEPTRNCLKQGQVQKFKTVVTLDRGKAQELHCCSGNEAEKQGIGNVNSQKGVGGAESEEVEGMV